jgi:hypothetical protein
MHNSPQGVDGRALCPSQRGATPKREAARGGGSVEVDGSAHDVERDAWCDAWLGARGIIRVVRVKAWMVERHISVVLDVIRAAL